MPRLHRSIACTCDVDSPRSRSPACCSPRYRCFRAAAHAQQNDLLDRAVAAWAKVKTARATFEQTITNSLTGATLTASGEYQQQRPGKLSVRFDDPANDRIVADGKHALALPAEHARPVR